MLKLQSLFVRSEFLINYLPKHVIFLGKNGSKIIFFWERKCRAPFYKFTIFQYRSTDIPLNDVAVLRLEVPIDFNFFPYVRSGN